jgi:signal peptidase II
MRRLGLLVAVLVLLLDQASKWAILTLVMEPARQIELTPFFNLVLAWNRGVSFSLLAGDSAVMPYALAALALAASVALFWWLGRVGQVMLAAALGLVMGGAMGNAIDRLRFGAVMDFLDVHAAGYHWPAFNLADSGITVGVALILADGLFRREK